MFLADWICSFNFAGSWMACTTSLRDKVTIFSTSVSISSAGTTSIALIRRLSSPERTSFRTTGDNAERSSYCIGKLRVPCKAACLRLNAECLSLQCGEVRLLLTYMVITARASPCPIRSLDNMTMHDR